MTKNSSDAILRSIVVPALGLTLVTLIGVGCTRARQQQSQISPNTPMLQAELMDTGVASDPDAAAVLAEQPDVVQSQRTEPSQPPDGGLGVESWPGLRAVPGSRRPPPRVQRPGITRPPANGSDPLAGLLLKKRVESSVTEQEGEAADARDTQPVRRATQHGTARAIPGIAGARARS